MHIPRFFQNGGRGPLQPVFLADTAILRRKSVTAPVLETVLFILIRIFSTCFGDVRAS